MIGASILIRGRGKWQLPPSGIEIDCSSIQLNQEVERGRGQREQPQSRIKVEGIIGLLSLKQRSRAKEPHQVEVEENDNNFNLNRGGWQLTLSIWNRGRV